MQCDKNLPFLSKKIKELNNAIFYAHSSSPLRINNTIIQTCGVDEYGCITFFIKRPSQHISQFDQEFPVALNYFKKDKDFFINIFGNARIVNDTEALACEIDFTNGDMRSTILTHVLITVTILRAEYYNRNIDNHTSMWQSVWSSFLGFVEMFNPPHDYNFTRGIS